MSAPPYMSVYIADYTADVQALTCEQDGAYWRLLRAMWRAKGKLPNNPQKLATITGLPLERWLEIGPDVVALFQRRGGSLTHKRVTQELNKVASKSEARSEAGKRGVVEKARKNSRLGQAIASGLPKQTPSISEPELEDLPPNPPSGGDEPEGFAKGWGAYPLEGRGNHGPDRAATEWPAAVARAGGVDRLQSAILAHAAQLQRSGGKAKTFDRWLRDGGFVAYLGAEAAPAPALTWHGPGRVLEIVADGLGSEAKALSYLARCTWQDMPRRAVIAPDIWVRDKLIEAGLDRAGYEILINEGRAA